LFPVFPVLFPVCSQIPANAFNVFLMFSIPDARAICAVFCIPSSQPGNTGNNGNSIEIEGVVRRARWNTHGTTGNKCQWGRQIPSLGSDCNCPPFVPA
jgi:hypothetical protein